MRESNQSKTKQNRRAGKREKRKRQNLKENLIGKHIANA
jgi:hypothetical protein